MAQAAQAIPKCADLIGEHLESRMEDISAAWAAYLRGEEDGPEDTGPIEQYGLSFAYHPGEGSQRGYWCWLISWGGPSEEFRFYGESVHEYHATLDRIEFRYHDWFDGAGQDIPIDSKHGQILAAWFANLGECGSVHHVRAQALEG